MPRLWLCTTSERAVIHQQVALVCGHWHEVTSSSSLKTAMFSTPGNPAHPPALGQLGRYQPLGLINGQPPRKPRRTIALGSAKCPVCGGEQASLLYLEGHSLLYWSLKMLV